MAVYKDKQRGTWYVSVYYTNWMGESDRKVKRGFKTRKEAVAWENTFLNKNAGDLNMTFAEFYDIYKSDLEERLKENTWVMKESVIELKDYLMYHRPVTFTTMLADGTLWKHLQEVDEQAEKMFNQLVKEICEDENINEELKEKDQICWVRSMNNVYNRATEIVNHELIYT